MRYLGVDVGKVVRIMLDPEQRKRVQVIADIDSSAPDRWADPGIPEPAGRHGPALHRSAAGEDAGDAGPLAQGHRYPVIRSVPSDFDVLLSSLPALATHATLLVDHLNQILDEENVRAVHVILANMRAAAERLPATLKATQDLVADVQRSVREIEAAATDLHAMETRAAPDIQATLSNVRHATESLAATSDQLDRFVAENEPGLARFTNQSLPEFEQLLRESRAAAHDFRDLSRSLKQNPSQLLYEPSYRGLEVPR